MIRLDENDAGFDAALADFISASRADTRDVSGVVRAILDDVKTRGDDAVLELTSRFDHLTLSAKGLAFTEDEIAQAITGVSPQEHEALELAAERIRAYHQKQLPQDHRYEDATGATLGWRWTPIKRAGLYVPGGQASYPSSVLMNAIPAKVAGVEHLAMCVPCPGGEINPLVLLAAKLSGVDIIYKIGGAQAVAALAYGTKTIQAVDKITGPGNAYVAEAKRQVFGHVGIDMIAGPSEVLVIADQHNDPDWIALDLLSQAEHDADAQAILVTDDAVFADRVIAAVGERLTTLSRRDIARASWDTHGAVIITKTLARAADISNRVAPEHLQICTENAEVLAEKTTEAGAIFIGKHTPEAIGDYVGGPNHVLPTSGTARFASGLSTFDFLKRSTISAMTPAALLSIGPAAVTLATSEALEAHALSVAARLETLNHNS